MDTPWHRVAMELLIAVVLWLYRGRSDYFVGGNMFLYYNEQKALDQDYKGPDFFLVKGVDAKRKRYYWAVWEEGGRFPNVIIELLSPSTAKNDLTTKKDLYERTFRTPEYFCCDPDGNFQGWRMVDGKYHKLQPNNKGWLWCEELDLWLGAWEGTYHNESGVFPRFFDAAGNLVPTTEEAEHDRADALAARIRQLEAERNGGHPPAPPQ